MPDIDTVLKASREAVDHMLVLAERTDAAWSISRAPGKWSPSQIVEHVALSLEESAKVATGQPSKFPNIPPVLHPVVRTLLFKRVLKNSSFPKAKTNKALNPASGPATPAAGRVRLETAHARFDEACRLLASRGADIRTTIFGAVRVEDYVRFMELHTRHHSRQMSADSPAAAR